MEINHISVSRALLWRDDCKYKYVCKYIKNLKGEESIILIFGSLVHSLLEMYVKEKGKKDLRELCGGILTGKILLDAYEGGKEKAPHLPQSYLERLKIHLRSIEKLTERFGFSGEVEVPFEYNLDPKHGEKMLVGVMDRVIEQENDEFLILDYKTTRKNSSFRKNKNTIKTDLQLRTYARIVQKKYGLEANQITAALYYLEDAQLLSTKFTEESLVAAEKELLSIYNEIQITDETKVWGMLSKGCDYCEFNRTCVFLKKPIK